MSRYRGDCITMSVSAAALTVSYSSDIERSNILFVLLAGEGGGGSCETFCQYCNTLKICHSMIRIEVLLEL